MKAAFALVVLALACTRIDARTSVPEIGEICGIRVGYDTMETLEHQLGHGLPQVGGHARGARLWRVPRAGCDIFADAFFYYDYGTRADARAIDILSVTPHSRDPEIPATKLLLKQARFLGVVSLGMSKADVLRILRSKLPPPKAHEGNLIWEAKGFVRVNRLNNVIIRRWRAELHFENNKLQEIRILCSPEYA